MIFWYCPHCEKKEYSSWDKRDEKVVTCVHCQREYSNPYYNPKFPTLTK